MRTVNTLLARIVFALPFVLFGIMHFMIPGKLVGDVPRWLPGGMYWVYFVGACMIAAGLAFITKIQGKAAAYLLAVLILVFILTVHAPRLTNAATMSITLIALFKDLGLLGGCLLMAGILDKSA